MVHRVVFERARLPDNYSSPPVVHEHAMKSTHVLSSRCARKNRRERPVRRSASSPACHTPRSRLRRSVHSQARARREGARTPTAQDLVSLALLRISGLFANAGRTKDPDRDREPRAGRRRAALPRRHQGTPTAVLASRARHSCGTITRLVCTARFHVRADRPESTSRELAASPRFTSIPPRLLRRRLPRRARATAPRGARAPSASRRCRPIRAVAAVAADRCFVSRAHAGHEGPRHVRGVRSPRRQLLPQFVKNADGNAAGTVGVCPTATTHMDEFENRFGANLAGETSCRPTARTGRPVRQAKAPAMM